MRVAIFWSFAIRFESFILPEADIVSDNAKQAVVGFCRKNDHQVLQICSFLVGLTFVLKETGIL